ncbi:chromosome partitioning protein ParB [Arthrobacter woluwensis]|uniref:ParB/RepB/Spo0J family partition protein n=1 Tax=Arthrobacter woluwensis TaxID=156980 RepID=UPI000D1300A1|nr:ParB/RepB/Spo0J family partition protein [Arthrobacter woluwensis]PSS44151.1 chromosome partitioning protein ParB [Arthrobacter woluwensis]
MSEKRRGLGRGLGALIPNAADAGSAAPTTRPVDLFFPAPQRTREEDGAKKAVETSPASQEVAAPTEKPQKAAQRPTKVANSSEAVKDSGKAAAAKESAVKRAPARSAKNPEAKAAPASEKPTRTRRPKASEASTPDTAASAAAPATDDAGAQDGLVPVPGAQFAEIPVGEISPNPRQPRQEFDEQDMAELVHSVREIGVLQPIVVRRKPEGTGFELVMGERRWRATQEAGLETVPAIIRETTDDDLLRDALLENLHRSQLNPIEEAAAYQQLLEDFGATHEELADRIGRSRPQVSNTIRLLKLPPLVQRRVAAGVLSAGHARALLGLPDAPAMERLAQRIVAEGLSVRATEEAVVLFQDPGDPKKPAAPRNTARHERLDYLATSLADRLDTNVKITLGARKGRVSIEFASVDDLNRIMDVINPS